MRTGSSVSLPPVKENSPSLQLLLARRRDLVTDQTSAITRLRETLLSLFPALERSPGPEQQGLSHPAVPATRLLPPSAVRAANDSLPTSETAASKEPTRLAQKALAAAKSQSVTLPAEEVAAAIVRRARPRDPRTQRAPAKPSTRSLRGVFSPARRRRILSSLPGMGPILGAEFLVSRRRPLGFRERRPTRRLRRARTGCPRLRQDGWATTAGCAGATRSSRGSSTSRPLLASARSPHSRAFYDRKRA